MPHVQWHVPRTPGHSCRGAHSVEEVVSEVLLFVGDDALKLEEIVYLFEREVIQVTHAVI
jgi:hypothetical protein